jgi:predicted SAM-dependent methyltransferase
MPSAKSVVKWMLRPVVRPMLVRLDRRLDPIRDDIGALRAHVSGVRDALSSEQAAIAEEARQDRARLTEQLRDGHTRLQSTLDAARDRMEFVRQELMYEMRYGASGPGGAATAAVEPRIINEDRVRGGDVRLNLGCGHIPLPDFVNVDGRELDHVDVVADVHNLPFPPGSLAQVHSAHLLEHFPIEELRRSLLPYWSSLLRQGGLLTAIVPDSEAMIAEFTAGRISFEELRLVTYGQQEYDMDFHFNMFSRASLCELLEQAGLEDVRILASARRNGVCYEMEVQGRRAEVPRVGAPETAGAGAPRNNTV